MNRKISRNLKSDSLKIGFAKAVKPIVLHEDNYEYTVERYIPLKDLRIVDNGFKDSLGRSVTDWITTNDGVPYGAIESKGKEYIEVSELENEIMYFVIAFEDISFPGKIPVTTLGFTKNQVQNIVRSYCLPKATHHNPKTNEIICEWWDGEKISVKCTENDIFDYQTGVLQAIGKKIFGSGSQVKKELNKLEEEDATRLVNSYNAAGKKTNFQVTKSNFVTSSDNIIISVNSNKDEIESECNQKYYPKTKNEIYRMNYSEISKTLGISAGTLYRFKNKWGYVTKWDSYTKAYDALESGAIRKRNSRSK